VCVEIVGIILRHNQKIKGIEVNNSPILISQYADDTFLISDAPERSFKESIEYLNALVKISGLKFKYRKNSGGMDRKKNTK